MIDTHCHLNDPEAFPDPVEAIRLAKQAGVNQLIIIGVDVESSRRALEIADQNEGVFASIGRHPNYAQHFQVSDLNEFESMLQHPKAVAVGEIGLDYHWDFATKEQQFACLMPQLDLARSMQKPIIFHCRKANDDLLKVLESRPPHPYDFHCFSGTASDAQRILQLDGYFGVDGPITYKKSGEYRELIANLPKDRILIETDSPYMSPEPYRGKPNSPANLPLICQCLASVWGLSAEETAHITSENARRLFGI